MKILKQREHKEDISYTLDFDSDTRRGASMAFPCDKDGNVFPLEHKESQANYDACLAGTSGYSLYGVRSWVQRYTEPAYGNCDRCGKRVYLTNGLDNTCKCGANYNMSGQRVMLSTDSRCEESYDYDY